MDPRRRPPVLVVTGCRHFWRTRNPILLHSPISSEREVHGVPQHLTLPPFVKLCRPSAGSIQTRPMADSEIRAATEERCGEGGMTSSDRARLMTIAAWARGLACATCRDGIAVEHPGCRTAPDMADDLETIAARLRSS